MQLDFVADNFVGFMGSRAPFVTSDLDTITADCLVILRQKR